MYNKRLRQRRLRTFAVLVGSSIYFLLDEKYISTIFLSSHLPVEINIKSYLLK
jgi:hypothetical protein